LFLAACRNFMRNGISKKDDGQRTTDNRYAINNTEANNMRSINYGEAK
jgi:hypothetical protein